MKVSVNVLLVPLSGETNFKPRPQNRILNWYVLGALFKISNEQPRPFYMGVPLPGRLGLQIYMHSQTCNCCCSRRKSLSWNKQQGAVQSSQNRISHGKTRHML